MPKTRTRKELEEPGTPQQAGATELDKAGKRVAKAAKMRPRRLSQVFPPTKKLQEPSTARRTSKRTAATAISAAPTRSKASRCPRLQRSSTSRASTAAPATPSQGKPGRPAAARPQAEQGSPPKKARNTAASKSSAVATTPAKGRLYTTSIIYEGIKIEVGDSVYVVTDVEAFAAREVYDDGEEPCEVCGRGYAEEPERPILECDGCLRGFHLTCLHPPLDAVPEGDWLCEHCERGEAAQPAARQVGACMSLRDKLLQPGNGLEAVRVEALWREPDGTAMLAGRWYIRPEDTHTGRQGHHGRREVFLTQQVDSVEVACVEGACRVVPHRHLPAAPGNDVLACDYEYDTVWQRFRRAGHAADEAEEEAAEEGRDWAPGHHEAASSSSSDDSSDGGEEEEEGQEDFKPRAAAWAAKSTATAEKLRTSKGKSVKGRAANQRKKDAAALRQQGIQDFFLCGAGNIEGLGAKEIPATARQAPQTGLGQARTALALTAAPRRMPCRDVERAQVTKFVEEALEAGDDAAGGCLYVSGVPGTGKTATVMEVMRKLKRRAEGEQLPKFQFVEINGLRLASPYHAYSQLYEALTGRHVGPAAAEQLLEAMFGSGRRAGGKTRTTVLLVDEMDVLVTRHQTVLYHLMEWPLRKGSKLAVIGVANTMDLPERFLPRIASRLGGKRVVFQPYTREQLKEIVHSRLEGITAFEPKAVNLCAARVASVSGDVRRSLELCRRAVEVLQQEQHQAQRRSQPAQQPQQQQQVAQLVGLRHVDAAVREAFAALHFQYLRTACLLDKVLLAALLQDNRATGRAEATMEAVYERVQALCRRHKALERVPRGRVAERAAQLGYSRLVLAEPGAKRLAARLTLNVPADDLRYVLQNDAAVPWLKELNL